MSTETESSKRWHLSGVLRRRWFIIAASIVLLFLVLHLILSFITGYRLEKTVARIEQKYGPLDPLRFAPPMVPYEQNRARLIRAALEARVLDEPAFTGIAGLEIPAPQTIQERMGVLRSILAKNAVSLNLLDEATKCPRANWHIDYRNVLDADSPRMLWIIRLARILQVKVLVEIQDGRPAEAAAAIRTLISLSESFSQERTITIQIIRQNTLDTLTCNLIRYFLTQADPAPAGLVEMQRLLWGSISPDSMWQSMVCEMASFHHVFLGIETGSGLWSDLKESPLSYGLVRWILLPATQDDHRYYLEYSERVVDAVRASSLEPWSNPRPEEIRVPHWQQWLSKIVLWWTPGRLEQRTRVGRDRIVLATTAIALRRFKLDQGHYPDELAALLPDYLDRVLDDAFTLHPPDYRREGDGFVLWSAVGEKSLDDYPAPYDPVLRWNIPR